MKFSAVVATISSLFAVAFATAGEPSNSTHDKTTDDITDVDMLVLGGTEVPAGQALYTTGLRSAEDDTLFCGGSLIDESHVISAAHCIPGGIKFVSVGSHYSQGTIDGVRIPVKSLNKHPQFNRFFLDYDFLVIELASPVDTKKFPPVKLANASKKDIIDGRTATLLGWGNTSKGGHLSNVLLKVDMPLLTEQSCEKVQDVSGPIVCAGGGDKSKSPCNGDSGGPLVVKDTDGSDVLVGIVSWGHGCGEDGTPSVYSSVADVADWIKSVAPNVRFD